MNELKEYLEREYPFEGKTYLLLRIAFFNDYHRYCRDCLLFALSKHDDEMAGKVVMAKLIGGAIYDAYDWLRHTDPTLCDLIKTKEDRLYLESYLQVSPLQNSKDKLADIVHGDGYIAALRASIAQALATNP